MIQALTDLKNRNWKKLGNPYECVGLEVLVLCSSGEILKAYRKNPSESKLEPNTYFRIGTDEPIDGGVYWDYI